MVFGCVGMIVLGVCDGHDAGAALVKDGVVVAAASEERFTRVKHQRGVPRNAIHEVFRATGLSFDEVDYVAVGGVFRRLKRAFQLEEYLLKLFPGVPQIYVDHHLCHAASAYRTCGWDRALIVTIDAAGDGLSATISLGKSGEIVPLYQSSAYNSVGDFFASITELLGFRPMSDEAKVACMAAHGDASKCYDVVRDFIDLDVKGLSFRNRLGVVGVEAVKLMREKLEGFSLFDIAAAAQRRLEELVLSLLGRVVDEVGERRIVFAGGIAANVHLNMRIREEVSRDLYVFPHMGDGGLCVGAALEVWARMRLVDGKDAKPRRLEHVFLGPEYGDESIREAFKRYGVEGKVEFYDDIGGVVADLLLKGFVVGRFSGRMEFGPRALGNRSVLALPTDKRVVGDLNRRKGRPWWQPFAPTILYERVEDYLVDGCYAPFMTIAFRVTERGVEEIPAVVHVDGTTRPQTVKRGECPEYRRIIEIVEKEVGVGAVLNTSMNIHGEPIVCSPSDAIKTFKRGLMDYLAIGNYLLRK